LSSLAGRSFARPSFHDARVRREGATERSVLTPAPCHFERSEKSAFVAFRLEFYELHSWSISVNFQSSRISCQSLDALGWTAEAAVHT